MTVAAQYLAFHWWPPYSLSHAMQEWDAFSPSKCLVLSVGQFWATHCLPMAWGTGKTEKRLEICKILMATNPTICGAGHCPCIAPVLGHVTQSCVPTVLGSSAQGNSGAVCSWAKQKQSQETFNCVTSHRAETATLLVRYDAFTTSSLRGGKQIFYCVACQELK